MLGEWNRYTPEQARMLVEFHARYARKQQQLEQITARVCEVSDAAPCSNVAYWSLDGVALCETCMRSMAAMNSDNEAVFRPALEAIREVRP